MNYCLYALLAVLLYVSFKMIYSGVGWKKWRRIWKGWLFIPTGLGVSVLTVLHWRRVNRDGSERGVGVVKSFQITCYRSIPLRAMSRAWGWLSHQYVPPGLRFWLYTGYSKLYGVNLDEMACSLDQYDSLGEFFIRKLKDEARPVALESLVSPADGSVINAGIVNSCKVEQVKGVNYTLTAFLGTPTWQREQICANASSSSFQTGKKRASPVEHMDDVKTLKFDDDTGGDGSGVGGGGNLQHYNSFLHLGIASIRLNCWMLGWLVFYVQFCIKDIVNSFFFGFHLIYGVNAASGKSPHDKMVVGDAGTFVGNVKDDDEQNSLWRGYKESLLRRPQDNELYQLVVYLAPGDYHRFHSPADWDITYRRHFQGELLSVNPKIAGWIPELFSLNERAVYVGEWQHGFFSMAAVGATNVGCINVYSDQDLSTNKRKRKQGPVFEDKRLNISWRKGEDVGAFRMGSTIVLLFEAPRNFEFTIRPGDKIRVGQALTNSEN